METIVYEKTSKRRPCLLSCVWHLCNRLPPIALEPSTLNARHKSIGELGSSAIARFTETHEESDEEKVEEFGAGSPSSTSKKDLDERVPFPCLCGARFGVDGKLIVFGLAKRYAPHSVLFPQLPKTYRDYRRYLQAHHAENQLVASQANHDSLMNEDVCTPFLISWFKLIVLQMVDDDTETSPPLSLLWKRSPFMQNGFALSHFDLKSSNSGFLKVHGGLSKTGSDGDIAVASMRMRAISIYSFEEIMPISRILGKLYKQVFTFIPFLLCFIFLTIIHPD